MRVCSVFVSGWRALWGPISSDGHNVNSSASDLYTNTHTHAASARKRDACVSHASMCIDSLRRRRRIFCGCCCCCCCFACMMCGLFSASVWCVCVCVCGCGFCCRALREENVNRKMRVHARKAWHMHKCMHAYADASTWFNIATAYHEKRHKNWPKRDRFCLHSKPNQTRWPMRDAVIFTLRPKASCTRARAICYVHRLLCEQHVRTCWDYMHIMYNSRLVGLNGVQSSTPAAGLLFQLCVIV